MRFSNSLIAVTDMERSLAFYTGLMEQKVTLDLGWCKSLTGGLTLQLHFDQIADFPADSMHYRSNTMELYFETMDMDGFLKALSAHPEIEIMHAVREYPWKQRGIHIYDPDGHLIEVAEAMESVAFREFAGGHSVEETANIIQHPIELVRRWYDQYVSEKPKLSVCGTNCRECGFHGSMCEGCNECEGKVFHSPEGCPIRKCVRDEKGLIDCAMCQQIPCEIWRKTRDPQMSDAEFEKNIQQRIEQLRKN